MLRSKPRLKYCGLAVILSNPSRFDTTNLLSASGGHLFNDFCLRPEFNSMMCDIRVMEDKSPFLPNTKCILLLGEAALYGWIPAASKNTLNEVRGSVYDIQGIPAIASYFPQDAADIRSHEQALNPNSKEYAGEDAEGFEDESEDYDSVKRHGRTKRANYAFWLRADTNKCKTIIRSGLPEKEKEPEYKIYPNTDEVVNVLTRTKGEHLYFDMETDYEDQNMQCFSFGFSDGPVYCVPTLDYNYSPAYSTLPFILRALAIGIRDNIIVSHNGATFDFFVLAYKYRIPVNLCYDTMVAMHRCFPDIEKSLGHCVSYWTWQHFHKDEDSRGYMTRQQMMDRLRYCGKDVFTMRLVHKAIEKYARTIPGLSASIDAAMSCIVPYLVTSLQGIRYDQSKVQTIQKENDRLMMQYMRCIDMLIGPASMADVRRVVKGKAKSFPGSNTQCCEYFHNMLGYPVIARSKKTGKPSLGKKAMFKLALKHDNPVINFTMAYRNIAKEFGTLKFLPWRDNDNKVVNWRTYDAQSTLLGQQKV